MSRLEKQQAAYGGGGGGSSTVAAEALPAAVAVEAFPVPSNDNSNNIYPGQAVVGVPFDGRNLPPSQPSSSSSAAAAAAAAAVASSGFNEAGAREYLFANGWPLGLQATLIAQLNRIPMRYIICDDSGSMSASDGNRVVTVRQGSGTVTRLVSCTRWSELTETLKFHIGLARAARAPTEFRMLNSLGPMRIGEGHVPTAQENAAMTRLQGVFEDSPSNGTPLCRHVREVIAEISPIAASLRAAGQKVAVIIATDGEPSDGDIVAAMRPLRDLPVWVVVRLCTDDSRITDYWDGVDKQLEINMDVIDDLVGESQAIHSFNPWLNYGEPMQRLREFGVTVKEVDLLDETPLTPEQMRVVIAILFNVKASDLPHPEAEWRAFVAAVHTLNDREHAVWNPATRKAEKWIDERVLTQRYAPGSRRSGEGCQLM